MENFGYQMVEGHFIDSVSWWNTPKNPKKKKIEIKWKDRGRFYVLISLVEWETGDVHRTI